jgi:urease accessory protein
MAHGVAEIGFRNDAGQTRLAHLFHSDPLRVVFPNRMRGDVAGGALVTTSGGLVGGDRIDIAVTVRPGARAQLFGQAAEKIYRSNGANTEIGVNLTVGADGWLEWLPQETILFDGARLRRLTAAEVAPGGRLLAGEMLVFGRTAMGEAMTRGFVRDAWEVRRDGRLCWADTLQLDEMLADDLAATAGFGGARAFASLVYVGDDAGDRLAAARGLLDTMVETLGLRVGASLLGDVLSVRWLGAESLPLRNAFGAFWAAFRHAAAGLPPALPRLWHI